ncbi:FtsW/RodA/SpoVE family cell cycle protein, partial [Flavobacteriaceae bacterium]|nr:FtsW/RodA/SpoVE family cell cycle protein [Flavobacteriaceae bacterium]
LPLISSGGTSIWMTCLALGILLSASNKSAQTAPATVTEETTNPLEILSEQL